ncbi:MAG: hypothetical protein ACAI35_17025 [Candidatus Methylacidiphilales bacterium]|nr:hypothetical protein [Candidatus Methylacidiphilales bacterium]
MKAVLLCLFVCILALVPVHAAEGLLIPEELNGILSRVRAGMTVKEVETLLATAYPGVKSKPGNWSGDAGSMEYKLNDQLVLKIASKVNGDLDKKGSNALVSKDLYLVILNGADRRRITLQLGLMDKADKEKAKPARTQANVDTTSPAQR